MTYKTIDQIIGNTPLVQLQRINDTNNIVLGKLEGQNPAGSVKDRPAFSMIATLVLLWLWSPRCWVIR